MFKPSNYLSESINASPRSISEIRSALLGYISADPWFETNEFDEAIDFTLKQNIAEEELFEKLDYSLDFEEDESKWDEDYYFLSRVNLKDNFCKERIEHVRKIADKLHPVEQAAHVVPKGGQQSNGKKSKARKSGTIRNHALPIGIAAAVIASAIAVVILLSALNK